MHIQEQYKQTVVTYDGQLFESDGTFTCGGEPRSGIMKSDIGYFHERSDLYDGMNQLKNLEKQLKENQEAVVTFDRDI